MATPADKAFTEIGTVGASRVFRIDSGIYLVRLAGYIRRPDTDAANALINRDNKLDRRAVLYEVSADFSGYDPDLRNLGSGPATNKTALVGIITTNTMLRLVVTTIALGLRAAKGIVMKTYTTVDAAVAGAREAMKPAS